MQHTATAAFPLNPGQLRIWFAEKYENAAPGYNVPLAFRVRGPLDEDRLRRALDELTRRHEALRVQFGVDEHGEPRQWIAEATQFDLEIRDCIGDDDLLREQVAAFSWSRFDLEEGPLARALLLRTSRDEHVLILNVHHIVFDDWSTGLLLRDLERAYHGEVLRPAPDYRRLMQDECARLAAANVKDQLDFWERQLAKLRLQPLPTRGSRWRHRRGPGAAVHFDIPARTAAGLRALARQRRCTTYMVLLAAFQTLLARWSGSPRVAVTSPVATRPREESEQVVGCLVNALVLTGRVHPDTPFCDVLDATRRTALAAYAHQDVPVDEVVRRLSPPRTHTGNPCLQVMFNFENAVGSPLTLPGLDITRYRVPRTTAWCDLLLDIADTGKGMTAFFEYDTRLFDASQLGPLTDAFNEWLDRVIATPCIPAGNLRLPANATPTLLPPLGPLPTVGGTAARPFLLSESQRQMWLAHQRRPGSPEHVCPLALRLEGALDRSALLRALTEVLARHEVLRATVTIGDDGRPHWRLGPPPRVEPRFVDLRAEPEPEQALRAVLVDVLSEPFDLRRGPLLHIVLARTHDARHVLVVGVAHVAFDGQSAETVRQELHDLYERMTGETAAPLPEPVSFRVYTLEAQAREEAPNAEHLGYWRRYLADATLCELPTLCREDGRPTGEGAMETVTTDEDVMAGVARLAAAARTSPYTVLLAAFQTLLSRWTGSTTVSVGTPVADRVRPGGADVVGFHVDTLVRRTCLDADPPFAAVVEEVRRDVIDGYRHTRGSSGVSRQTSGCSFDAVVATLQRSGEIPADRLYNVLFDVRYVNMAPFRSGGVRFRPEPLPRISATADLTVDVEIEPDGSLACVLEYATDLFDGRDIRKLGERYLSLLRQAVAEPGTRVSAFDVTLPEEPTEATPWGDTAAPICDEPPAHVQVLAKAAKTPDATALVCDDEEVTYGELATRTRVLARQLTAAGVRAETPVGVHLTRGPRAVVALLAVASAGGAFLPLDPNLPVARKRMLMESVDVRILVTEGAVRSSVPDGTCATILDLDAVNAHPGRHGADVPAVPGAGNLAYLIHTSGTTGRPKAVMGLHGSLAAHSAVMADGFGITADDRVLQFADHSFDAALEQILPSLIRGATVILRPDEIWAPEEFCAVLRRHRITVAELPPAYWTAVVNRLPDPPGDEENARAVPGSLRLLILGGEAVSGEVAARWLTAAPGSRLINTYGPTETTVTATAFEVTAADAKPGIVPIGGPRRGIRTRVLDAAMRPVPTGAVGELYIGGHAITRGYLCQPSVTAERFVPDPVESGQRLYRSGDRVRLRDDGVLEFVGRIDDQVKIRGFRVELGEISTRLVQHASVESAVVLLHPASERHPEPELAAYVVPADGHGGDRDVAGLRRFCAETLPEYMVPALFVFLDALPLTSGGKVDRRSLPDPRTAGVRTRSTAPRDELEALVADVFAEVLDVTDIGAFDDFFALGGHSLSAMRVVTRIREVFEIDFTLSDLYATRTVAEAARAVLDTILPAAVENPAGGDATATAEEEPWKPNR